MNLARCLLKPGKERPLRNRHPWIFSGAIDQVEDTCKPGDLVQVLSSENEFLGVGYINTKSQITVRMLAFEPTEITPAFFEKSIQEAISLRKSFLPPETNAYRVIHAEGDFLPGLIADYYDGYLVVQFQTAGMEKWKDVILGVLQKELSLKGILEKDDSSWRELEGLSKEVKVISGDVPQEILIQENGLSFYVHPFAGQKTGFYLDQRDSRKLLGSLSHGKTVLDCFSYTGGFSVYAAKGGAAHVVSVDSSESALKMAKRNFEKNGLAFEDKDFIQEDLFDFLRKEHEPVDLIVLDPPAFCKHKQQVEKAARGYKDINRLALKILKPGGMLLTFSCSSYMDPDLFQKVVFSSAAEAKREVRILSKTGQPFDHPMSIFHPEGEYLKGLLCQVKS